MEFQRILKEKEIDSNYIELSNKDGVFVVELIDLPNRPILKYFEKEEYRREIYYYTMLRNNGIKTINVINYWDDALLLENMQCNVDCRLATHEDLLNEDVIISLARWYKKLHQTGREILKKDDHGIFYSEYNLLVMDELSLVKENTGYYNDDYWSLLQKTIEAITPYYLENQTITYNDFYYGNVIVSQNQDYTFMFDYNYLKKGLAYSDVSNVFSGLDKKMHNLFLGAYGGYHDFEKNIDQVISPIISLIVAYKRNDFPDWANDSLNKLVSGELYKELLEFNSSFSLINY